MQPTRLKKRKQFVHIAQKGRKIVSSGLILQFIQNKTPDALNVGFTVTKKVGNAVVRNRVRRRLREVVRLGISDFNKTGYDFVLIGRQSTINRPFDKLRQDFATALEQVQ